MASVQAGTKLTVGRQTLNGIEQLPIKRNIEDHFFASEAGRLEEMFEAAIQSGCSGLFLPLAPYHPKRTSSDTTCTIPHASGFREFALKLLYRPTIANSVEASRTKLQEY